MLRRGWPRANLFDRSSRASGETPIRGSHAPAVTRCSIPCGSLYDKDSAPVGSRGARTAPASGCGIGDDRTSSKFAHFQGEPGRQERANGTPTIFRRTIGNFRRGWAQWFRPFIRMGHSLGNSATMHRTAIVFLLASFGCATFLPGSRVDSSAAPSPAQQWVPPHPLPAPPPATPDPTLMAEFKPGMKVTLRQLLVYALSNNPQTRSAWLSARAAAAGAASKRSTYYPQIDGSVPVSFSHQAFFGTDPATGRSGFLPFELTTLSPGATLTWLLLDLGGRSSDVAEADRLLEAANLFHDATIQNLLLSVEQA